MSKPLGSVVPEVRTPVPEDPYWVRTVKVLAGCGGALIVGMFLLVFLLLMLGGDEAIPNDYQMTPQPTSTKKPGAQVLPAGVRVICVNIGNERLSRLDRSDIAS